jgi:hypothetical protein
MSTNHIFDKKNNASQQQALGILDAMLARHRTLVACLFFESVVPEWSLSDYRALAASNTMWYLVMTILTDMAAAKHETALTRICWTPIGEGVEIII